MFVSKDLMAADLRLHGNEIGLKTYLLLYLYVIVFADVAQEMSSQFQITITSIMLRELHMKKKMSIQMESIESSQKKKKTVHIFSTARRPSSPLSFS